MDIFLSYKGKVIKKIVGSEAREIMMKLVVGDDLIELDRERYYIKQRVFDFYSRDTDNIDIVFELEKYGREIYRD